jgi:hypothetical protein
MTDCLCINRGFSRAGGFLTARGLDDFLGTHDCPGRPAMHGEKNAALLRVVLGIASRWQPAPFYVFQSRIFQIGD